MIGRQSYTLDLSSERFRREISRARTFGCMSDVARLWNSGFALGASFDNSVVFDETRLLNPEGLRYSDECARHKVLDVIGDLALAGLPLLGAYRSVRGGQRITRDRSYMQVAPANDRQSGRAAGSASQASGL
jgi:UDP-3-O-[3-hydroxymyristoyl] N-acetylglucosamine deacetylase